LGGTMPLHRDRAEAALADLGRKLGLTPDGCAQGIYEIVNRQMALAVRTHVVERGRDPRRFALVAFGGAGPVHAYEVARHLRIGRIVYPPVAGVASALGFLISPFVVESVRTFPGRLDRLDWAFVAGLFADMERRARGQLGEAGADLARVSFERSADMRYVGQGYEVAVSLPRERLTRDLEPALRRAFQEAYQRRYGAHLTSVQVEAVHWRLTARVEGPQIEVTFPARDAAHAEKGRRQVFVPERGGYATCTVLDRYRLSPGTRLHGPVVVEERESTIFVGPSASAEVDGLGNLLVSFDDVLEEPEQ
jgi:N-methylhydantoinase A